MPPLSGCRLQVGPQPHMAEDQEPGFRAVMSPPVRRGAATPLLGLSEERGQEHEADARQEHCVGKH